MSQLVITILVDNPNSWIIPFARALSKNLSEGGHDCLFVQKHKDVREGDILIMLSCIRIFKKLTLNKHNLVVHESDLPRGRGMSPFTWQILEGKNRIPVTLLEATDELDAGVIYDQTYIELNGSELVDEWRALQGEATVNLLRRFISKYPEVEGKEQVGEPTYYRSRIIEDSRLNVDQSIEEQFNLLRVVDNNRYPAWFERNGVRYKVEITKLEK
jgi:methionyl-tRNA formyltransferase